MKNIHLIPTYKSSKLLYNHTLKSFCFQKKENGMFVNDGKVSGASFWSIEKAQNNGFCPQNIYITSDEEIKEGDWILYCNSVYKVLRINSNNRPVVKMSDGEFELSNWNKIILTDNKDLIKDGVQAIDDESLEWFVKNPSCEEVEVGYRYSFYAGQYLTHYKIIIPIEEAKQRAKNYMSLKGALEPKQIKCYCGHTIMCDCSPIDEAFGIIYVLETLLDFAGEDNATNISISTTDAVKIIKLLKQI